MKFPLASSLLLLLTSCTQMLSVETQYWDVCDLASSHVHTPDSKQFFPNIGQKLFISWSIPQHLLPTKDKHLQIQLRFRNRQECAFSLPIEHSSGTFVYAVMNQHYDTTCGILSYKISLIIQGKTQQTQQHPLWTPTLHLPPS